MKILALGNSFSEDATAYLKDIADAANMDLKVVNLYIGGCNLEAHANNIKNNLAAYRYELNGLHTERNIAVKEALEEDEWDIVTMQQASHDSGIPSSYGENGKFVAEYLRANAPKAKLYFHRTWAYEIDTSHGGFLQYNRSQDEMHRRIIEASGGFCNENGNIPVIPCGEVVAELRKTPEFDYANGGESILCEDGFHMHRIYGRYAAAATWFEALLGGNILENSFIPSRDTLRNSYTCPDGFITDISKIELIKSVVHEVVQKMQL